MSAQPQNIHENNGNDHGGDGRELTVVINAREQVVTSKDLTFEQLVTYAFPTAPSGDNVLFTISYRRGHGDKPEGSLLAGESVKVKDGMVFVVSATDKS
jgi:hypothetical protein